MPLAPSHLDPLLSGRSRGLGPAALRALLSIAEPLYSAVVSARNGLYDAGILQSHRLPVPVISIGNITTGGTGKTPVVRWLAQRLLRLGMRPAILLRGYKRTAAGESDEQALLQESLADAAGQPIPVRAHPDRLAAARQLLQEQPRIDVLLLDDGFQHRRLHRDFNLVLIDALCPFGHDHVLPRGLLREPLRGLRRADAFILTRCDQIDPDQRKCLEEHLRGHNHQAPVYPARHAHAGLRSPTTPASADPDLPLQALAQRPFFAFAGIGRPDALDQQLRPFAPAYRGHCWLDDHHHYSVDDLSRLQRQAAAAGAQLLLTTDKDWVKLRSLPSLPAAGPALPICRLALEIEMEPRAQQGLLALLQTRIARD